jgi:hypothetical protein
VRAALDAAWGFPNAETKTQTAIDPADTAPRASDGRVMLVISSEYCGYEPAATMLPQLLASGAVEEITEAEYQAAVQPPDPLQG